MLSRRRTWLERVSSWGTALAVPLVAIVGFKLLAHARDGAAPVAAEQATQAAAATAPSRVLAPPIDAAAPPVVELRRSPAASDPASAEPAGASGDDPRCAALERAISESSEEARRAVDADSANRLRERDADSRSEARALRCRLR